MKVVSGQDAADSILTHINKLLPAPYFFRFKKTRSDSTCHKALARSGSSDSISLYIHFHFWTRLLENLNNNITIRFL